MSLHRFVPNTLRPLIAGEDRDANTPYADELEVALMFADISGFTALMEHHAQRGPAGVEELTRILNGYFGRIIRLVTDHGGDVTAFAGDALTVVWNAADDVGDLASACVRASQCALAVQQLEPDPKARVSMRVAVCAGRVRLLRIGGERDRRFAFMIGEPIAQLGPTLKLAQPGEVAVSPNARTALTTTTGESLTRGRVIKPRTFTERIPERPLALVDVPAERTPQLQRYVPRVIRRALESSGARPHWIGQFRQISAMFVRLPAPDVRREDWLGDYHRLLLELQRAVYKFGGRVDKITSEEKGILLLAVWGLPGATHEDDPLRAVQAAVQIRELLGQRGHPTAIGIATGKAYCGLVGSEVRSEYTIVGTVVNRAARIVQKADGVLCDEVTRAAAEDRVEFADGRPLTIRGISAKVVASEPLRVYRTTRRRRAADAELVGRDAELSTLRGCVDELVQDLRGRNLVVLGKPGIGKSRLLEELRCMAVQRGVAVLETVGDAVEADAPYTAIRPIVAALLGVDPPASRPPMPVPVADVTSSVSDVFGPQASRSGVSGGGLFADDPELAERAPLLEAILPCGLGETEFTRALAEDARAGILHAVVAALLRRRASAGPVLVLLDDAHWFDSASLSLARALTKTVTGVLFALAVRPEAGDPRGEFAELQRDENSVVVDLQGLDEDGVVALIARRLRVKHESVPRRLCAAIRDKTEGNPLFIEQLALALVDSGNITVHDGVCRVQSERESDFSLPATLHGILNSRLDQLPPEHQHFLRIASVVGRTFDLRLVGNIYVRHASGHTPGRSASIYAREATAPSPALLDPIVAALAEQGIVARQDRTDYLCAFRHTTMMEAIYETLLFAQRREVHRAVAQWYEDQLDDLSEHLAQLAHHWSRAGDRAKARHYLELAGARALQRSASAEAARLLEQLLALVAEEGLTPDPDRAARWREQLCEAYFRVSNHAASLRHGLAALELLGAPLPRSTLGMLGALLGLILERNVAALPRKFPRDVPADQRARRRRALKVQRRLTDIYGYTTNAVGFLLSSCRELAIADACDAHGEAACAHLMLYFIVSVTPMKRIAAPWLATARELLTRETDRAIVAIGLGRIGVAYMQGGDFDAADRTTQQSLALALAAGDLRVLSECRAGLGLFSLYRGLYATAERHFDETAAASDFSGDEQFAVWATIGRATCMEAQGRVDEALRVLARAAPWLEQKAPATTYIWGQGVRALVTLRAGDRDGAAALVHQVLERLRGEKVLAAYWMLGGIEAICVVAHELLAAATAGERRAISRTARECHKFLALLARTLPFAAAHAAYQEAALARVDGSRERELAALQRCVALATKIDAMHLLAAAWGRIAELSLDPERARSARALAEDATRRRATAELTAASAPATTARN